jgi:hypothetical protein
MSKMIPREPMIAADMPPISLELRRCEGEGVVDDCGEDPLVDAAVGSEEAIKFLVQ